MMVNEKDFDFRTLRAIFTKLLVTFHLELFIGAASLLGVMAQNVRPKLKQLAMVGLFLDLTFTITENPDLVTQLEVLLTSLHSLHQPLMKLQGAFWNLTLTRCIMILLDKSTFHHFPLQYYRALWVTLELLDSLQLQGVFWNLTLTLCMTLLVIKDLEMIPKTVEI